jgi:hypothetical protein
VALGNLTGGMFSFDISFVDQSTGTYYLADRSNKRVDSMIGETTFQPIVPTNGHAPFAGFTACAIQPAGANDCAGPNGVVTGGGFLFVTDAPSRVLSFNLASSPPTTVSECTTKVGEPTRADELALDPRDGVLLVINNAASPPFGTIVTIGPGGVLTCGVNIPFDAAHGVDARNGAEQPVWDPTTGFFYVSIPQIGPSPPNGGIIRISSAGVIDPFYPGTMQNPGLGYARLTFCSPAGLALGPNDELLANCNTIWATDNSLWTNNADRNPQTAAPQLVILNAPSGNILAQIFGAGVGDEVWFNRGDNHFYAASSGSNLAPNAITPARPPLGTASSAPVNVSQGAATLDVVDALSMSLDQRVPTLNVPASSPGDVNDPHPAGTAHSVAAFSGNNHVYVPIAANNAFRNCLTGCVAIYGRSDSDPD